MTDRQLFAAILNHVGGDALKAFNEYERCHSIRAKISQHRTEIARLAHNYETERKRLDGCLVVMQAECTHPVRTRHADPSGNSGSFIECDICGMQT